MIGQTSAEKQTVLITGATGQVGTLLIECLRERGNVNIILAARDPKKLADCGLPVRYFDYDDRLHPRHAGTEQNLYR